MTSKSAISRIFILLVLGCSPPKDTSVLPDSVFFQEIIDVIFDGVSSRLQNNGAFSPISGKVAIAFNGAEDKGTFRFSYSSFTEPTLCNYGQSCLCTGLLVGSFTKSDDPNAEGGGEVDTEVPYDPNAPTTSPAVAPTEADTSTTITFLKIMIDYNQSSMGAGCPAQTDRLIKVSVHNTKQMVITDFGRELLLLPRKSK